ncbi:FkbM family methyltransferase [Arenibacterium halophilum]|uniref:FkbM family methyltransferase n=1 Tax=Arenibacterium halophilum TaxID=2583821 RepID=A0ABY2XCS9_9RHOB|nr:FkbM family methyltransferase [Arenibacterium halophilum]TMV14830.1 FkbM family methyltransferase [Arenibacterium halophilum]
MQALKPIERALRRSVPASWRKYFRASGYELVMRRRAPVDLVVHVGAHWGEDAGFYESCGADTVLWVEADPDTYVKLSETLAARKTTARHLTENALVSSNAGETLSFHRFKGDGASSSVHRATEALHARFPDAGESGDVLQLPTRSLDEILARHGVDVAAAVQAMLVVDVQGHELEVLKGLGEGLDTFRLCKCEVSRIPLYAGGAQFTEIDSHMRAHGFRLVSHKYFRVPRHGDVLYLRD